jgi:type III secretory pathway component EscT
MKFIILPSTVHATNFGAEPAMFPHLEIIFTNILNLIIPIVGIAVFIMLLVGGFGFLTSGASPEKSAKAKQTITWAVIGLIVILAIWFVLRLIEEFTGVTISNFEIPTL